jgi:hypothetical protein
MGRGLEFGQMKGNTLAQGEIIAKEEKYTLINFKKSTPEPAARF